MTEVKVTPKRKVVTVNVKVSNTGQVTTSQQPVTVQTIASPTKRFDALADVDATTEVEGGVPVYHAANDTYTVESLNLAGGGTIDEIDGGTYVRKVYINRYRHPKKGPVLWKDMDLFTSGEIGNGLVDCT